MSISTAHILTKQFYEWERRGRGWHIAPGSCDLEPVFVPFFGHFIPPGDIIDDAKVPSVWSAIRTLIEPPENSPATLYEPELLAYPFSGSSNQFTLFAVILPRHFRQSRERMVEFLTMLSYRKAPVSFEIIAFENEIKVQWTVQDGDAAFFETQAKAFFPECMIRETFDDMLEAVLRSDTCLYTVDFGLEEEFMRPIAHNTSLERDPYTSMFGILERLDYDEAVVVQILFSGTVNVWTESILTSVLDTSGKGSFFIEDPDMPQLAQQKIASPLCVATVRVLTASDTSEHAAQLLQHVATSLVHASRSASNALLPLSGIEYSLSDRLCDFLLRETHRVGMLININELVTLIHFPSDSIASKKLRLNIRNTKAVPSALIGHDYTLGINEHLGIETLASITTEQRLRHLHIMGATGTGKSTLLKSLIMQDVKEGTGLMCLDPHGDLIESILEHIPQERIKDVVLIDPSDTEFPIGLNILLAHSDIEKELLASDLVALFRRFSTSWGDQMNSVFANAILAFVYNTKQYHLGDLRKFLIEVPYRNHILNTVTDPDVVYYWQKEYPILKSSSIGSILTRLDAFLRPKVIRNMVCQTKSLDFAHLMDSKKIVLVKLSQGLLGEENSYLLGAFIVSKLQQIAMARQSQRAGDRVPFFCYIDEFQHFVTPSMATILSGTRKYGLGLVVSHQDMQQVAKLDAEIASSVLTNAGTRICFKLGDTDAKKVEDGFSAFAATDLQNLVIGEAIVRVNTPGNDFNIAVIAYSPEENTDFKDNIVEHSRASYSVPIVQIPSIVETTPIIEPAKPITPPEKLTSQPIAPGEDMPKKEGIREHRYLQTFIKGMAEAQGYKASLEVPTPNGNGHVDVLLEKDGLRIAVEISVTTTAEWELHNIEKCLAAGYEKIVVCSTHTNKLKQIEQLMQKSIAVEQQVQVFFMAPDTFQSILLPQPAQKDTVTMMKGYRVKVQYDEGGTNKQDLLKSIIKASQK